MIGISQPVWSWRASLVWALLGPTLILLAEVESALALLDGLGLLPGQLRGWQALIAGAVLVVVIAAQLSAALSRRIAGARRELSAGRRKWEEAELLAEMLRSGRPAVEEIRPDPVSVSPPGSASSIRSLRLALRVKALLTEVPADPAARRIHERFGLEPSWAFQQLDESLGVPAARRLARGGQLTAGRWAGQVTALGFAAAAFLSTIGWLISTLPSQTITGAARFSSFEAERLAVFEAAKDRHDVLWSASVLAVLLALLAAGQYLAALSAGRAVVSNESQFYPQVETLLELHRFDLYRALAIRLPRGSRDEQKGQIAAWRLSTGRISFERDDASDDGAVQQQSEVQQQVAGLAELLRGPELVAYDGYISWEAGDDYVELAFAHTPVLGSGHARLQVNGSGTASHAPFDIAADSDGVTLVQVRASVHAPVSEGTARRTFDFQRRPDATQEIPELWFEISQRGRFIQLLRVKAPRPSSRQKST